MFKYLGRFTAAHPWKICAVWLALGVVLTLVAPAWDTRTQDDDIRFLPARCDGVRGYHLLEKAFPQDVFASRLILAVERPDAPLTAKDFALADQLIDDVNKLRQDEPDLQLGRVYSHHDPMIGKRLISADRQCVLVQVALGTPYLALQTRKTVDRVEEVVRPRLAELADAPRLLVTGPAGVGRDVTRASADSLEGTTLATVVLVLVILLLVYRAPLLALVPLVTIAVSTWVALKVLALMTLIPGVYLVNVAKIFAIVLLYGAGTDYCLFLISRYREELGEGGDLRTALSRSVGAVGSALAASAGTVICGLSLMGFAEFAKVRCAGPAIALSLGVVLLASLTLAPALLHLLGKYVFWPHKVKPVIPRLRLRRDPWEGNLWDRISRGVIARPLLIWVVTFVLLLPLAWLGLRVKPNYKPTGELSPATGSVQGLEAIQTHFTEGETGPVTVLLVSTTDWDSPQGREVVAHLSRGFARLENVAEVRSLTQPLGTPLAAEPPKEPPKPAKKSLFGGLLDKVQQTVADATHDEVNRSVHQFYLAQLPAQGKGPVKYVTRLDVVLRSDPFSRESIATLNVLQTWLRETLPASAPAMRGIESECYGVTVNARDLAVVTEADRCRVNWLVLAGVFLILVVLVRRPGMAGYLLVSVLFSYWVTLGATALFWTWWMGRPLGELDWRVPFFLFTILVAVGEDYNILLMTRALKERRRYGGDEGMRRALARTGGAITSCGLIMAGTFATLMLAGLGTLVQIGFALAFGVLLDTFVVRPFLVPAFTVFLWRQEAGEAPPPPVLRPLRRVQPRRRAA
jgi:putative drug exporter of the RND superfamily